MLINRNFDANKIICVNLNQGLFQDFKTGGAKSAPLTKLRGSAMVRRLQNYAEASACVSVCQRANVCNIDIENEL